MPEKKNTPDGLCRRYRRPDGSVHGFSPCPLHRSHPAACSHGADAGQEIGAETHARHDLFFRFKQGRREVVIDGATHRVSFGAGIVVPSGAVHTLISTREKAVKVCPVCGPTIMSISWNNRGNPIRKRRRRIPMTRLQNRDAASRAGTRRAGCRALRQADAGRSVFVPGVFGLACPPARPNRHAAVCFPDGGFRRHRLCDHPDRHGPQSRLRGFGAAVCLCRGAFRFGPSRKERIAFAGSGCTLNR